MIKRTFLILNTILFFCGIFSTVCYDQFGGLWLKAVTSGWFVLLGIVNFIYFRQPCNSGKASRFPLLMLIGLLLCFAADIILNITFIPGALIFAIGHIFYFAAYCGLLKFEKRDLLPSVFIFIPSASLVLFVPIFDFGFALMQYIILLYALIISLMVGKSIANMKRNRNSLTSLIVFGSCLFFFSDLMLLLCYFAGAPQITDSLCLFTYYPGQYLLAHSLYRYVNNQQNLNSSCKF